MSATIFEIGAPGRRAFVCPELDVEPAKLPEKFRRAQPPRLPEVSEPELVRHYVRLSKKNFDLDSGFYPLGSCTMKHNPRLHKRVAALSGNPNTLGVFDPNIEEIASIVHKAGGTLYYDGANLNAVMGISRPGDMGFDIVHFNLHKSFTQPHGGGGPGSGPIAVSDRMAPFLMVPRIVRGDDGTFALDEDRPKSIGRLRGFQGNYGAFVRSYAYIRSLGREGLRDASETAVLNANYLLARLRELGVPDRLPLAFGELCMHEFVLSGAPMKRELKIKTLDLAKRLLDHGFHPPTVYFPLLVDEALLVEPTETETRETLDAFAEAIAEILREAREDPTIAREAPPG